MKEGIYIDLRRGYLGCFVPSQNADFALNFDTDKRRFYLSIIALIAISNKKNEHCTSNNGIDLIEHAGTLFSLSVALSGSNASQNNEHVIKRILQAWGSNRFNTLYGDKNEYKYFSYSKPKKRYTEAPHEHDDLCWRKLVKRPPSINSTSILFDIQAIGLEWEDVFIKYDSYEYMPNRIHHIDEWEVYILDLGVHEIENRPLHKDDTFKEETKRNERINEMVLGAIDCFLQEIDEYEIAVKDEIEEWVKISGSGNTEFQHKVLSIVDNKCSGWLYNKDSGRDFVINGLPHKVREIAKTRTVTGIALIDVDDLTQINNKYGSSIGDSILQIFPLLIYIVFATTYCGRCGDDTFFALLADHEGYELHERSKKFLNLINTFNWERLATGLHVTCSIGLGPLKSNEKAINAVQRADIGMSIAKKRGKNKVREGPPNLPKIKKKEEETYKGNWS
ncbi:MAG: GGDEF domain-containing protein [Deltaproteobacteria bacterium]|nr:GGDEF domain-containing protein [Deltaproteobacteria bacterium]